MRRVRLCAIAAALWLPLIFQHAQGATPVLNADTLKTIIPQDCSVEAFLLHDEMAGNYSADSEILRNGIFEHYPMRRAALRLNPEERTRLLALLLDPASHDWKPCLCTISPRLGFRFTSPSDTVSVIISPQIRHWLFRHGDQRYIGTFSPIQDTLQAFGMELFPNDPVLRDVGDPD